MEGEEEERDVRQEGGKAIDVQATGKRLQTASCEATTCQTARLHYRQPLFQQRFQDTFAGELSLNGNSASSLPLQCVVATLTVWFRMGLQLPASK